MANPIHTVKHLRHYVTEHIWTIRIDKVSKRQGFIIRQLRVFSLAIRGFRDDNCLTSATALTFYTLFSIVPVLALVFAIAKGFGFYEKMQVIILKDYSEYEEVLTNAFIYANKMLSNAQGGVIAGFGIALLLWSVLKLLMSIENIFNQVWEIKRGRSWIRKLTDYLTIMLIGPILFMISGGLTLALTSKMGNFGDFTFIGTFFLKLFAYSLVAGVFSFIYMALPNTKVNFKSAFAAGIVATVLFELLGWGYIKFQIGASRLSAIYGGFAALPLFLIFIQYTWYIVLFGVQFAYASQNVEHFELADDIKNLSNRYKKTISLMIANLVAKHFYAGEPSLGAVEIATKLDLPVKLARHIINEFVETGIFVEVKTETDKEIIYQPGVTESRFDVKFVLNALDKKGVNSIPITETAELASVTKFMHELDKNFDSEFSNLKLKDL